jgi:hypothetical protein
MSSGIIGQMYGMKVIVDKNLPRFKVIQFRFPRSKGKRIRKKFAKCVANFKRVKVKSSYIFRGNTVVVHPDDLPAIKHMLEGI